MDETPARTGPRLGSPRAPTLPAHSVPRTQAWSSQDTGRPLRERRTSPGVQRATQGGAPSTWGVVVQGLSPLVPPPSGGVGTLTLRSSVQRRAEDTCSSRDGPKGGRTAVNLPLVSATGQQCLSSRGAGSRAFAEDGGRSGLQGLRGGRGGGGGAGKQGSRKTQTE